MKAPIVTIDVNDHEANERRMAALRKDTQAAGAATLTDERTAFEAAAVRFGWPTTAPASYWYSEDNDYSSNMLSSGWAFWQARAALASTATAPSAPTGAWLRAEIEKILSQPDNAAALAAMGVRVIDHAAPSAPVRSAIEEACRLVDESDVTDDREADICQGCKGNGGSMTGGVCAECYGQGAYSGAHEFVNAMPAAQSAPDSAAPSSLSAEVAAKLAAIDHFAAFIKQTLDSADYTSEAVPGLKDGPLYDACERAVFIRNAVTSLRAILAATPAQATRLLQGADVLFAHHCSDATAANWLDDVRGYLANHPAQAPAIQAPAGFVLMPKRMTRAIEDCIAQEDWDWGDLLAAAETITDEQHASILRYDSLAEIDRLEDAAPAIQAPEAVTVRFEDNFLVEWSGSIPDGTYALATPSAAVSAAEPVVGLPFGIIDPDYATAYTKIRIAAWQYGYAIGLQGSFTRDLDLIAVPWTAMACPVEHLVKQIEYRSGLKRQGPPKEQPHGRLSWSLLFPGFEDPRWVDLSVVPLPTPAPAPTQPQQGTGSDKP